MECYQEKRNITKFMKILPSFFPLIVVQLQYPLVKGKKKKKNKREVNREDAIKAYKKFILYLEERRYNTDKISEEQFLELATNPQTKVIDRQSIEEAEIGLTAICEKHLE